MMRRMARRKELETLEKQTADEFEKSRKRKPKRVPAARGSARGVVNPNGTARRRKPPPVPKNKSLAEIKAMDPDDPAFKHKRGAPRKAHTLAEDTTKLSYREVIRREKQRSANRVRARARKGEAVTAKAIELVGKKRGTKVEGEPIDDEEALIAEGVLDLDDWDARELARGYRRQRNGKFGIPPKFIPREVHEEAFRRLVKRGERLMKEAYLDIVKEQIALALDGDSEKVKLEAQKVIQERLIGKVPDTLRIGVDTPWQDMLADSLELVDEPRPLQLEIDDDGVARIADEPEVLDDA